MRRSLVLGTVLASVAWCTLAPASAEAAVVSGISSGTLTIIGDAADDKVVLRLAPGSPGTLLVEGGGSSSSFARSSFAKISVRTGGGADEIRIDEGNGTFTDTELTTIESGAGQDVVVGGRGAEVIATGDDGDFVLAGHGGDTLMLGAGNDTAVQGNDDGTDVIEGQTGSDTLHVSGSGESEEITAQAVGTRALITRDSGTARADLAGIEQAEINAGGEADLVDIGDLSGTELARVDVDLGLLDGARDTVFTQATTAEDTILASVIGDSARVTGLPAEVRVDNANATTDRLVVQARGGDDNVRAVGSVGTLIGLTLEGNEGQDQVTGGTAAEVLRGGPDSDTMRGHQGADTLEGGAGNDLLIWSPVTDGNDTIGGDEGEDGLRIPTTSADDAYDIAADGSRVRIIGGASQLSLDGAESIEVGTGTGADRIGVRDLTGTGIQFVRLDVGVADLKVDTVHLEGTLGADSIKVVAGQDFHELSGLSARTLVVGAEPGDQLHINGRDGDDTVDASRMFKDKLMPFLSGGAGKDVLVGSPGQDQIRGGSGVDVAILGAGLDTFTWLPGEGNDIVEGGSGTDFLQMSGSGANERFTVSPIGSRARVIRDVSNVVLDLGDVERLDIIPTSGADTMRVDDLSGTDITHVVWDLAPFRGTTATDGAADSVLVNGTFGDDTIDVSAAGHQTWVEGLAADVVVTRSDPTLDTLHVDTRPGLDKVSVAPGVHSLLKFTQS